MKKTILITGSTDGIGLATAKTLLQLGHTILLHGRSDDKLLATKNQLLSFAESSEQIDTFKADLSVIKEVNIFCEQIKTTYPQLDVLINNAGVYVVQNASSVDGLDVRFMVNTISPFLITQSLLPHLGNTGRVVNVASAAQAPLAADELRYPSSLPDNLVYAKSKLALMMWTRHLSDTLAAQGPVFVSINPKSLLASKMVKEAYGIAGSNIQEGADILVRAALSDEFSSATGLYFDNDISRFAQPHPDALDTAKNADIANTIEQILSSIANH